MKSSGISLSEVRLIALDMDGTLLLSDHRTIPQENIDAIREADRAGIKVCISTGRMIEDASDFIRRLDLPCAIIASNGACASDGPVPEHDVFLRRHLRTEDALKALEIAKPFRMMINGFEAGLVNTILGETLTPYHLVERRLIHAAYGWEEMYAAARRGIMKLYIVDDTSESAVMGEKLLKLRELIEKELAGLQITSSDPNNIEIMSPQTSKGTALSDMAERYGLKREQVMAVGDAPNDLAMLEYAWHSVAMGNADEIVRCACRYQTETNDQCGVAKIIRRVLCAR